MVDEHRINAPAYDLEIPAGFKLIESNFGLSLNNESDTITLNIDDITDSGVSLEEYIEDVLTTMKKSGQNPEPVESVIIGNSVMYTIVMAI